MIVKAKITDDFGNPVSNANIYQADFSQLGNFTGIPTFSDYPKLKGVISDKNGNFTADFTENLPITISHVAYDTKKYNSPQEIPDTIVLETPSLDPVIITATKPKSNMLGKVLLFGLGFWAFLKLGKASDEKTAHKNGRRHPDEKKKSKGLKGTDGKNICTNRIKCKGIDKKTGKTKDGYYFGKNGKVVRKHKGLTAKGTLKKGYKYAKGGRIVKVKKQPKKVTL